MNWPLRIFSTMVIAQSCMAATAASALPPPLQELWTREAASGTWGGAREQLGASGIELRAHYTGEVLGVARGGLKRGASYNGLLELALDIDLEKLASWPGATLHMHALYPHGSSGTGRFGGDLGAFSSLDFYDSYRLFELWLEQRFFDDRFSLRIGQLAMDEEFAAGRTEYSGLFINSGFGVATAISGNFASPIYAIAALGVRLKIEPTPGASLQLAAYDGNPAPAVLGDSSAGVAPSDEFNHYGTHWALRSDEGALLIAELGYTRNAAVDGEITSSGNGSRGKQPPGSERRGLFGSYKAGVAYHTDTFSHIGDRHLVEIGSAAAPRAIRESRGNLAIYLALDQELWREPRTDADGLGVFLRGTFAPADRNFFRSSAEGGVVYRGLLQENSRDQLGVAFAFFEISDRFAAATRAADGIDGTRTPAPDYEAVLEITYTFELTPWWTLQPDLQWIIHPGGSDALGSALVIGVRSSFTF